MTKKLFRDSNKQEEPLLLEVLLGKLRNILGIKGQQQSLKESIEGVLDEEENNKEKLTVEERLMLLNVLSIGKLQAKDVLIPRANIIAIDEETSIEEAVKIFHKAGHSRLPLYKKDLDDVKGMIHIKDLLLFWPGNELKNEKKSSLNLIKREILFIPPSMPIIDILLKMQVTRLHMAIVVDEFGGVDGLLTIEDLVEEITGEIEDEHDKKIEPIITKIESNICEADARIAIKDIEKFVKIKFFANDNSEDIDTLGGLIFSLIGRVPLRGEIISHSSGVNFEITDADPRRVKRVRIIY
jgi:CBS domain containing-hemolysin-like protein